MKILHICVNFHENLFLQLITELSKKVDKQFVFHPRRKCFNTQNTSQKGIQIYSPVILNHFTRFFYLFKMARMWVFYRNFLSENSFAFVHAHTLLSDGGLAYLIKIFQNKSYIVAFRSSDVYILKKKPWLRYFAKLVLKNAEKIVIITPDLSKKFEQVFGNKYKENIKIIPNGIDNEYFKNTIVKKKIKNPKEVNLLYVGSFIKRKKVNTLIDFVYQNDNYKLEIVGKSKGDLFEYVKKAASISERINYLGEFSNIDDLKEIYLNTDIFTLISYNETFGRVYIEALSQGVPIIYSKNHGVDGLFKQGEVGYAVNHNNPKEWEEAIQSVLNNYESISDRAYKKSKDFSWEKISYEYLTIYKQSN